MNSARFRSDALLFLVAVIWGSSFAVQRVAAQHLGAFLFNGLRFLMAVLILLPFARPHKRLEHPDFAWMVLAGLCAFAGSALQQAGLIYTTAANAGFITSLRLVTPVQWLSRDRIVRHLGRQAARFDIDVVDQTGSTNTDMLDRAMQGARSGSVLAAESQTQGRGRRGRDWQSSPGGALTFSILWRFDQGAGFLSGLSLVVGIALARVLRKHGAADVMLKWPNDLLWRHLKLAGILIELAGDVMGPTVAVIGIGINLRLPESVKARIDQPVVDLAKIGVAEDRNMLFAEILGELDSTLRNFSAEGFASFREEWDQFHAYQDKMVRVRMPDKSEIEGRVQGVGDDGALLLQTRSGPRKCYGGELSLRGIV